MAFTKKKTTTKKKSGSPKPANPALYARMKAKTKKKKSKAKRTYRGFVQNNSTNQTKAQKDSVDEKMIVPQDKDTLIRKLAHYVNQLSSEERSKRIGAAKYVNRALLVGCKESKTRAEVWSECLMKPILKLVADPVECVREISLELIRGCATLPEVDFGASLPYLFPVLMGCQSTGSTGSHHRGVCRGADSGRRALPGSR